MIAGLSMLALTLGGGGILLSIAWLATDGWKTENIRPALAGLILVGFGLVLPVDPSPVGDTSAAIQPRVPGPVTNSLNLPTAPTISARLGVACKTNVEGLGSCWGSRVPVPQAAIHKIILGRAHGCALMQTGELSCWGSASNTAAESVDP